MQTVRGGLSTLCTSSTNRLNHVYKLTTDAPLSSPLCLRRSVPRSRGCSRVLRGRQSCAHELCAQDWHLFYFRVWSGITVVQQMQKTAVDKIYAAPDQSGKPLARRQGGHIVRKRQKAR